VCARCSWITDTYELSKLAKYADDKAFHQKWRAVKQENKAKLAAVVKETFGDDVPLNALFDIQVGGGGCCCSAAAAAGRGCTLLSCCVC
jgi:glucan phosphorylase